VIIPGREAGLPAWAYNNPARRLGLENFLAKSLKEAARRATRRLGTGKSGLIEARGPGQEILWRSAVQVLADGTVEARFFVGLPAAGRRILAEAALRLLTEALPRVVEEALIYENLDQSRLRAFVETTEDAEFLREKLSSLGLVAFVADGSILPRASGVDPRPAREAVPFESPPELAMEIVLPNRGLVRGMGIPKGVTLIVGGGFHGKSTLLRALEQGVYHHVPGDGRELVVSLYETVKIRAEDGRSVVGVDISPFINNLPFGRNTKIFPARSIKGMTLGLTGTGRGACPRDAWCLGRDTKTFTTPCASGSTSQAANIMEALEVGAKVLLLDEDTSATNFMIRDARMQALIAKEKEPITPFLDRVRELYERLGVSTVLVVGGCGDYLEVADTVIAMDHYRPKDVTRKARLVVEEFPTRRRREDPGAFILPGGRRVKAGSLNPRKGAKEVAKAKGKNYILFGRETIDLSAMEQLVDEDQTRAIAYALLALSKGGDFDLSEGVRRLEEQIRTKGVLSVAPESRGDLAAFRRFELAAALNRLRSLVARPV
jgi:predicted ABC-class ATPase